MSKFTPVKSSIEGLLIVEPTVFGDTRGFFMESYSEKDFLEIGITEKFVQDNHSMSKKGVLRGLHFQTKQTQGKLVRVLSGSILDVAVDLRPESKSFGKWEAFFLSAENKHQLYIPPRFAHGFLTLEESTQLFYKCTDYYNPGSDGGLLWNDPNIGIDWDLEKYGLCEEDLLLSEKDKKHPTLDSIRWEGLWEER